MVSLDSIGPPLILLFSLIRLGSLQSIAFIVPFVQLVLSPVFVLLDVNGFIEFIGYIVSISLILRMPLVLCWNVVTMNPNNKSNGINKINKSIQLIN